MVVVHGGGFTSNDRSSVTDLAQWLASSGLVAMTIDYRLAPQWPTRLRKRTSRPQSTGWVPDIRRRCWHVRRLHRGHPHRLGRGSGIVDRAAAWSGAGSDPALTGRLAAQTAIEPHLGCSFNACADLWSSAAPTASVTPGDPPLLQVHSVCHPILGVASARSMADAYTAQGNPVRYDERPGSIVEGGSVQRPRGSSWLKLSFLPVDGPTSPLRHWSGAMWAIPGKARPTPNDIHR